jgi:hypothetical protein
VDRLTRCLCYVRTQHNGRPLTNAIDAPMQALEASLPLNIGNRIPTREDETTRGELHQTILSCFLILDLRSPKVVERAVENRARVVSPLNHRVDL